MHQQSNLELAKSYKKYNTALKDIDTNFIELVIDKVKERATFISDFDNLTGYFFETPQTFDVKALKKAIKIDTVGILQHVEVLIKNIDDQEFLKENIETKIKDWMTNEGLGFGKVMMPLRLSLVGSLQGPDVFEIAFLIGKNETLKRIQNLIKKI